MTYMRNSADEFDFDSDYDYDLEDELDDDDELYRPLKANSRKDLVSLFVYRILTEGVPEGTHLSQKQILSRLSQEPYEIELSRGALSRTIHGIADCGFGIVAKGRDGVWFDSNKIWADRAA